jgi:hypothetical protein
MLASMLYHTNQITNVEVKNVEYLKDKIIFHTFYLTDKTLCSCCGYEKHSLKGKKCRLFRLAL